MRLFIACDVFPPLRSSGAVQLRDLALALAAQGHQVSVLVASPGLGRAWQLDALGPVRVLRLASPRTKDIGYVRRTLGELLMPHFMRWNLSKSPLAQEPCDGVIWYSPTIFLGPLVSHLKARHGCRGYLILRDIFPEWAVDMGLMGRGLPYRFFKSIADQQYRAADVIGIQSPGNRAYFDGWPDAGPRRVEVLPNWLADAEEHPCSIDLSHTPLAGRKILVYAGNMGVAQGMQVVIELAEALQARADLGFVFVGRGSEAARIKAWADARGLDNVLFHDEIAPEEIPALYAQCRIGIVALDPRHQTHNIPGKFLSYMAAGLPVLASINPGNDLVELIRDHEVGHAATDGNAATLAAEALELADAVESGKPFAQRCRALSVGMFSPSAISSKVVAGLMG